MQKPVQGLLFVQIPDPLDNLVDLVFGEQAIPQGAEFALNLPVGDGVFGVAPVSAQPLGVPLPVPGDDFDDTQTLLREHPGTLNTRVHSPDASILILCTNFLSGV